MSRSILKTLSKMLFNTDSFSAFVAPFNKALPHTSSDDFHAAKVTHICDNNDEIFTLSLKVDTKFYFSPGQYVELFVEMNGRFIKRCFSISSSIEQFKKHNTIDLTIKKQVSGKVTPWLRQNLALNTPVAISQAKGEFILKSKAKDMLFIASGSGITPFKSLLMSHLASGELKQVTLMYFERGEKHIFVKEFEQLAQNYPNFKLVKVNTAKQGRLSVALLNKYCDDFTNRNIHLCGSANMIIDNTQLLLNNSVARTQIFSEQFTSTQVADLNLKQDRIINYLKSNKTVSQVKEEQNNLLSVSQSNDIKANYGCGIGICHECKCKKHSGIVFNTKTQTYSDNGEEDIQLCISIPVTHVSLGL